MLELVAVVFLRAAKSATANLGLGAPGGDPGIAPGAEDAGSHRWGSCFSYVNGFLQLVMEDSPARRGFIGVGEESTDSGTNVARLLVKVVLRSHLEMADWVDFVFLGEHLSIVRQVLLGTDLQASERLSA